MNAKKMNILYVAVVLIICIVPFVCMPFFSGDTAIENKTPAAFPEIKKDGKINLNFFDEFEDYFTEHIAFRGYIVASDAKIQSLFGVSAVDTVIKGTDGWLYYSSTADDYTGKNTASDRKIYNTAHNISLLQKYVLNNNAEFVFTIAPNKNSLYGENMPYYYLKTANQNNMAKLKPLLATEGVNYIDLFEIFSQQDEILYLKEDSHWNNKGAVLAYRSLMQSINKEYDDYSSVETVYEARETSDLGRMLYAGFAKKENNFFYKKENVFEFVTQTDSVEDPLIVTSDESADGSLLMFRDSFGNTLLPLFADEFKNACFSKGKPCLVGKFMSMYSPDTVIVEIVERNVTDFATDPPVLTLKAQETASETFEADNISADIIVEESFNDFDYMKISGNISCENYSDVYVEINGVLYEAYTVSENDCDYKYISYIPKAELYSQSGICVYIKSENKLYKAAECAV